MAVYKITYLRNEPVLCTLITGRVIEGEYIYEYNKDSLIYALINANSEDHAIDVARKIAVEFRQTKGTSYMVTNSTKGGNAPTAPAQ